MTEEIIRSSIRVHADITQCEKYLKKLDIVSSKVKVKDTNKDNIIDSFVQQQIEWRNRDLDIFKKRLEICNIMTDIIKNYEYGFLELINEVMETETKIQ
jgi:hypothetical protein